MLYLDTSFVAAYLLKDPGYRTIEKYLARHFDKNDLLVSSALLEVELCRLAHQTTDHQPLVHEFLSTVSLVDIRQEVIQRTCEFTGELKSLDAIHLATASILTSPNPNTQITFCTNDLKLARAAEKRGFPIASLLQGFHL